MFNMMLTFRQNHNFDACARTSAAYHGNRYFSLEMIIVLGLSVRQSKSDSIRNGIIMNGANETEDSSNTTTTALAIDGSIDKNAIQLQSVDDVICPINSSNEHQPPLPTPPSIQPRSGSSFDQHMKQFVANYPDAVVLKSEQKDDTNELKTFDFNGKQNVELIIHRLDINKYLNYLQINFTSPPNETKSFYFTEFIEAPNMKTITLNNVQQLRIAYDFSKSEASRYLGYVLSYRLLDTNEPHPVGYSATNTSDTRDRLSILIEVPKSKQTNETLSQFRTWLTNSTNKFIDAEINVTGINVEKCSEDNVTLVNITACKTSWPNAQNCVKVDFSIRLRSLPNVTTNVENQTETSATEAGGDTTTSSNEFDMDREQLVTMWVRFGRKEFADNGFNEFPVPDARKLFLVWTSVSLAILAAFLMVLAAIWKMDVLRDYRRMYWNSGDDEKQICKSSDVAMYPAVHQTVPTLFPNDLSAPNISTANALPFEFVSKPITYSISDFKRRPSIEESLKPSGNSKRKAGEVPFQSDTDFNESKQDRPEDEMYFDGTTSPRLVD
ncbi:uncharacterized protein LOC129578648 isoform X2 [Sitodiplosis mosellana]|uniref:uncharacterized protein LOC129578648 isoform X2 n=1 Tax=Sitodiplosis mosellana TaxID=263140 RepID=UPI0024447899|nr:uncharacterized protein LOC129578648 isoform X2 [Sitodiplosis mosellana]